MLLVEDLYRVFLDYQHVALQDARTTKIVWRGVGCDIPTEYLNYNVTVVMSCTIGKANSEIVIIIA